jgi:hypothetical protein
LSKGKARKRRVEACPAACAAGIAAGLPPQPLRRKRIPNKPRAACEKSGLTAERLRELASTAYRRRWTRIRSFLNALIGVHLRSSAVPNVFEVMKPVCSVESIMFSADS